MKNTFLFFTLALMLFGCAKKENNDSTSSSPTSNSYLDPTTGAVIGSFTCSETESDSEVFEIFQLGTTNCNFYCETSDGKLSNSECYSAWKNGERNLNYQFIAKSWTPLNTVHNSNTVYLYNFTPSDYDNVSLSDSNGTFKTNISIKAWNRIKYSHSTSGDNITVNIPTSNNPIMSKFANIKTKWSWAPHNYDPNQTHANWWTNFTGSALRAYYTMNYSMAYYLSLDSFQSIIDNNSIEMAGANVLWHDSSWSTYDNNSVIVSRMRDIDAIFRIGVVHGGVASGLGGGDVHGVAPHVLWDFMRSNSWSSLGWNGSNIWLHEFAHCLGFSHSSNMTYPQSAPNDSNIPNLVQDSVVAAYNSDNSHPLFPPGNGQDGIDCKSNLAGIECDAGRSMLKKYEYWHLSDDFIKNHYK
jgi:hypothetical protein